jgi:hypothetical protein
LKGGNTGVTKKTKKKSKDGKGPKPDTDTAAASVRASEPPHQAKDSKEEERKTAHKYVLSSYTVHVLFLFSNREQQAGIMSGLQSKPLSCTTEFAHQLTVRLLVLTRYIPFVRVLDCCCVWTVRRMQASFRPQASIRIRTIHIGWF